MKNTMTIKETDIDHIKNIDHSTVVQEMPFYLGADFDNYLNKSESNKSQFVSSVFFDKQSRRISEVEVEQTLSTVFNQIESEVSHVKHDHFLNFSIELSGGRHIDVKSELRDYSWNFSLSTNNKKLKSQLINSKKSMSSLLRKSLGRRVHIDVL